VVLSPTRRPGGRAFDIARRRSGSAGDLLRQPEAGEDGAGDDGPALLDQPAEDLRGREADDVGDPDAA
jgi:hypothetical protein